MASPIVTNAGADLNGKTLLLAETSASVSGGLIPATDAIQVGWILRKVITLSHTQIIALPTTPIEVIPAPGANKIIHGLGGAMISHTLAGSYTNIDVAAFLQLSCAGWPVLNYLPNDASITNGSATRLTDFFQGADLVHLVPAMDTEGVANWGPVPFMITLSEVINQPLQVSIDNASAGMLTGGNAANTLQIVVYYTIIDLT